MKTGKPSYIDRKALPAVFPTHAHSPLFWEQLGRTVATFGFLEEVLGKAIFVLTGTRIYGEVEVEDAWQRWPKKLEKALSDPLSSLAKSYGEAVRGNQDSTVQDIDELVERIKTAAGLRNVLCHASWRPPDAEGKSLPFFVSWSNEVVETKMDIQFLRQVHDNVADLACTVIDTVTQMGWQFPGGGGVGETIWIQHNK